MSADPARVGPPAAAPATGIDTAALRRTEFPWADETVYLNHASIGPLPERTRLALEAFNRRRAMPFQLPDRDLMATLAESRRHLAGLIGATPEEIENAIGPHGYVRKMLQKDRDSQIAEGERWLSGNDDTRH